MPKIVTVQPHIQDSVLRDPFQPTTWFPNELIHAHGLSLSALGLLLELVAGDDFDVEAARAAELKRRAGGCPPEDINALLGELEAAGCITVDG
ncbi:hypothetical protein OIE52_39075 [Streptomyces canus]|uniref:hypothetical protein n=1 Tax=Streptomyces canus TaxID=58343 RepID=UPI0032435A72